MKTALEIDKEKIAAFCQRWRIQELDLFGSVLRDDFGPESDVDFLVVYAPGAKITLFDEARMQEELGVLWLQVCLPLKQSMLPVRTGFFTAIRHNLLFSLRLLLFL